MKHLLPAIRLLIVLTLILGLGYPLAVTGLAQIFFPIQANGSLIRRDGVAVGSRLIAQKTLSPKYFWPRPSAVDYNPLPSGGSNLGPISAELKKQYDERARALALSNGPGAPPPDLLFASASGLDPHISVRAAEYQLPRVAKARGLDESAVRGMIRASTEARSLGFLGEEGVNVLLLNLALDQH